MCPKAFEPHDWREWRRLRALELARLGWKQNEIALALDVSEGALSDWLAAVISIGPSALYSRPKPGRPSKLDAEQLRRLPGFLLHGAEAYGFRGDVWTCQRVAGAINEEFGVSYSKSQVSRLLKRMGWTPQSPITRAIQRDEEAIERWRDNSWPALKQKALREHLTLIFVDESGFYLLPGVVRTYAPRAHTPTMDEWQTRDHLSAIGAVTSGGKVFSLVRPESLNGSHTVAFLEHLLRLSGKRLLVIWDNSPIHRRAMVQAFLAGQAARYITVEALPSYAPDLNPVEWLWQHLKDTELRNVACLDMDELHLELHLAIGRVRQRPTLVRSFFDAAELSL
ncbi:MAG TPA: IS630 family transposase [Armatimonadota bacterium]|nr:IS630 family transposase [Armatimonadota bacterium]